ncbi:MAG TPA: potassium-transporting ATPase subunit C, partial [Firmicutes bacterium]|nr:potassium-transporting ATPase subunit C [Bacillota bacterium]
MFIVMTAVTGIAYPLAVTGLARILFPYQAAGSLLHRDGQVVGSVLIGQGFT